jgi:hypothetical protein
MELTKEMLDKFLHNIMYSVRDVLSDAGSISSHCILIMENGDTGIVYFDFCGDNEKIATYRALKQIMIEQKPIIVVFITEVWVARAYEGEQVTLPPRDDPNKMEAVMCTGVSDGYFELLIQNFERTKDGKPVVTKEPYFLDQFIPRDLAVLFDGFYKLPGVSGN